PTPLRSTLFPYTTLFRSKKSANQARLDPHSSEGLIQQVSQQEGLLRAAVKARDFTYIDERAYYLQGVLKALNSTLDPQKKQQLRSEEHTSELQSRGHLVC